MFSNVTLCWTTWQSAMEDGTVAEWIASYMAQGAVLVDKVGGERDGRTVVGHNALCVYYNTVMSAWGWGCGVVWGMDGWVAVTDNIIKVVFDLDVTPMPRGHVRKQVWTVTINNGKIAGLVVEPFEMPLDSCSGSSRTSLSRTNSVTSSSGTSSGPCTPPCRHNNWENLRVKRGYAILRCRDCSSQWRVCPTDILRCREFGKELDKTCSNGPSCSFVHIHFTRLKREAVLKARAMKANE